LIVEPMNNDLTRTLRMTVAALGAAAVLSSSIAPGLLAQAAPAQAAQTAPTTTLATTTLGETLPLTVAETEGPYFKTNSPEITSLATDATQGTLLTVTGQVLTTDGTPVPNALLDFWQADASGTYDNTGYNLRGHQYTDANGYYTFLTVVPGLYPGRTRHIHVKVQAPNGPALTTQLFFAGEPSNSRDGIFDPSLVLNGQTNADGTQSATFNFVVQTA
jgi:protocatechuate 3,4-dioxygenase beta subunit